MLLRQCKHITKSICKVKELTIPHTHSEADPRAYVRRRRQARPCLGRHRRQQEQQQHEILTELHACIGCRRCVAPRIAVRHPVAAAGPHVGAQDHLYHQRTCSHWEQRLDKPRPTTMPNAHMQTWKGASRPKCQQAVGSDTAAADELQSAAAQAFRPATARVDERAAPSANRHLSCPDLRNPSSPCLRSGGSSSQQRRLGWPRASSSTTRRPATQTMTTKVRYTWPVLYRNLFMCVTY